MDTSPPSYRILSPEFARGNNSWDEFGSASLEQAPQTLRRSVSLSALVDGSRRPRNSSLTSRRLLELGLRSRWSKDSSLLHAVPERPGPIRRLTHGLQKAKAGLLRQYSSYASLRSGNPVTTSRAQLQPDTATPSLYERTPRATLRPGAGSAPSTVRRPSSFDAASMTVWWSADGSAPCSPAQPCADGSRRHSLVSVSLPDDFETHLAALSDSLDSLPSLSLSVPMPETRSSADSFVYHEDDAMLGSRRLGARFRPRLSRRGRSETSVYSSVRQPVRASVLPAVPSSESLEAACIQSTSSWSDSSDDDILAPRPARRPRPSFGTLLDADLVMVDPETASVEEAFELGHHVYSLSREGVFGIQSRLERRPGLGGFLTHGFRADARQLRRYGLYYCGICRSEAESEAVLAQLRSHRLLTHDRRLTGRVDLGQLLRAMSRTPFAGWKLQKFRDLEDYLGYVWELFYQDGCQAPAVGNEQAPHVDTSVMASPRGLPWPFALFRSAQVHERL